jgi:hypothetical protein
MCILLGEIFRGVTAFLRRYVNERCDGIL